MIRRSTVVFIVIFTIFVFGLNQAYASTESVLAPVTLPTFNVVLNGIDMDNQNSKYPFIVYKEITYFPMTYNACRFLGLESNWKGMEEGLRIDMSDISAAYSPDRTEIWNSSSYYAMIPTFPIHVNGKLIDNSTEEYPFLIFRDITYFPITWRFAYQEFGWGYRFDPELGLSIRSNTIQIRQSVLPEDRDTTKETMAIAGGYVYYVGTNGQIMQSSIDLNQVPVHKVVFQLPINSFWGGSDYVLPKLYSEDGKAYLSYYSGGATMGTDYLYYITSVGASLINNTRNARVSFGEKEFQWWIGSAPGPGNLYMKTPETVDSNELGYPGWKNIGDPKYLYGWNWHLNDVNDTIQQGAGGTGSREGFLIGDDFYILAFDTKAAEEYMQHGGTKPTTGLYWVDCKTNDTTRVSEQVVTGFRVEGDVVYYHNEFSELFKYDISEDKEYPLLSSFERENEFIERFEVLGGQIYFECGASHELKNSDFETIGWGVHELKLTGSDKEYLACTLSGNFELPDKILVFNQEGKIVFRSSDDAYAITVEEDKVYYFNKDTNTICIGDLSSILE